MAHPQVDPRPNPTTSRDSYGRDGAGNYTMEATFSTSGAKGRPGFLEITATTGAKVGANGIEGKNTSLAMLPVKFDIAS